MTRAVHQLVPNLAFGDAISQQALALRTLLRSLGRPSEIYAEHVDSRLAGEALPYRKLRDAGASPLVLFHFSIGSEVTDFYRQLENRRVLVYHNITPPEFFRGVNESVANWCARGREELATLRSTAILALADSEFNRRELEALGFARSAVLPIVLDPERFEVRPVKEIEVPYRDGHKNFLHVGRIVPNKRLEDVIKTFYFYRRKIDAASRLFLVGIDLDTEIYRFALDELIRELGLAGVVLTGGVDRRELASYYRIADLYLCMSEHEGFCAPLVEAMYFGVPVIAYASTAIPETLGPAGILATRKNFSELAELASVVFEDAALRGRMIRAGRERARAFLPEAVLPRLRQAIDALE